MSQSIQQLINRCKDGESKAQIRVYDMYCEAMYIVAYRYLGCEEDAKDAMQDGFLKAFTKLNLYKSNYSFGSWLKRIVINQCIDKLKRIELETVRLGNDDFHIVDDEDWEIDIAISEKMVMDAIAKLSENYQIVLKLYLIEGFDHQEISEFLKIPIKTSRTHLRRGKLQLKELLKDEKNEARSKRVV
jgi:RNA polymerase sigma factor (sigma-70 family)